MAVNNGFSHFGGGIKVAKVTTDGVTHTATMQAGYTGAFQWQVDGVDVAGETGATFTPVPALPHASLVRVAVTSLAYTSQAHTVVRGWTIETANDWRLETANGWTVETI